MQVGGPYAVIVSGRDGASGVANKLIIKTTKPYNLEVRDLTIPLLW